MLLISKVSERVVKTFCLFLLFVFVAVFGDKLLAWYKRPELLLMRAVLDNSIHVLLGILSWLIVSCSSTENSNPFYDVLLCGFFSSFIDIDHFLEAKSLKLQDAVNLNHRPFLHNSTVIFVVASFLLITAYWIDSAKLVKIGWIFAIATFSHHVRDGLRHGLWFWPWGSTKRLNMQIYIIVSFAFPLIVQIIFSTGKYTVDKTRDNFAFVV